MRGGPTESPFASVLVLTVPSQTHTLPVARVTSLTVLTKLADEDLIPLFHGSDN